jgi:tetratricopeptide (TPR) repeat protein
VTRNSPAFQAWLEADAVAGPQRSYRLARKLPDVLRVQGHAAAARADWALAHTLFWMGRFEESRTLLMAIHLDAITLEVQSHTAAGAALPRSVRHFHPAGSSSLSVLIPLQLAWALALLGEADSAVEYGQRVLAWAQSQADLAQLTAAQDFMAHLYCFLDAPETTLEHARRPREMATDMATDMATLLEYWALSRLGHASDEIAAQTALARLRRQHPAHEARAFSLYAQAQFHQSPGYALTQLDAALDLNARFGLHHWEARLLHLKSQSLDAAGQLTEASRFRRLAIDVAQRQGARLFLNDIAGIESHTLVGS